MRRPVFMPIWWQSLAATRLQRITSDDRERRALFDTSRKKDERALQAAADAGDPSVRCVNLLTLCQ